MSLIQTVYDILLYEVQNNPMRLIIDVLVLLVSVYVIFQKSFKPHKKPDRLTPEEEKQVIDNFNPEPLVPESTEQEMAEFEPHAVTLGTPSPKIRVEGVDKEVINFGSYNFLNFAEDKQIIEKCKDTVLKYGVGSCGPRGFYGSIDVHIYLENKLKDFYGAGGAILYSFGFCTISSIIPVFAKREDTILTDEACNFAVQVGVELSRSKVFSFKHNDVADMEDKMKQIVRKDKPGVTPKHRRFLVIQGVYENHGDVAPLDKMVQLAKQYKFRVVLEDTFGVGVLGKTGRGTHEHFNIPITDIDILTASCETALGSGGAYCIGSRRVTEHQRLASTGYCFSAASPPYFSTAAIEAIKKIEETPQLVQKLKQNSSLLVRELKEQLPKKFAISASNVDIPIAHIKLADSTIDTTRVAKFMKQVVKMALKEGVAVVVPRFNDRDRAQPAPSIRLTVEANHTEADIKLGVQTLATVLQKVLV